MNLAPSLDRDEIAKFNALADEWWNPDGPMRPLHQLNPLRVAYIRDQFCLHLQRDPSLLRPLHGLDILDVGCGGGLLTEPLARLGANVTAIDAGAEILAAARAHGEQAGLDIVYRVATAEEWAGKGHRYDAIVSMEVIEHVADIGSFVAALGGMLNPGGTVAMATINRTAKSYAMAIVGAERILRWLPPGTHDWKKFVKPGELSHHLRRVGVDLRHTIGVSYRPAGGWHLDRDKGVNYMALGVKDAGD
jgi:2-polyprenyl-6-hydroxyphenyl methylase/3-demethylubiquinone-9 3-methyltransferase